MPVALFALAIGAFGIGLTEFVVAGILPQIATDFGVDIPTAGLMATTYALGVFVGAPILTVLGARIPRKTMLIGLALLFTIGNISPLLGLLGTIMGMINAFDAIARAGAGDPSAVASGISEALITTATGLIVAIPTIVFHRYLSGRADKVFKSVELYCHAFANTLLVRFQSSQQQG